MDTINIAICDDEKYFIDKFGSETERLLKKHKRNCNIFAFNNASDLMENYKNNIIDAVFLDISMPDISGFEAAEELRKISSDVIIIFITSHEDMVFQSWQFEPFWFVRKSHLSDMKTVISKLIVRLDTIKEKENNIIRLYKDNTAFAVNIDTVTYIEASKHYILFHYKNGATKKLRAKITDIEQVLFPYYFVRIQNGIIVNCRFITKITSRVVILQDGNELNISRTRLDNIKNEFQRFIRSR